MCSGSLTHVSANREGWLYLVAVQDAYSRRIVGGSMAGGTPRLCAVGLQLLLPGGIFCAVATTCSPQGEVSVLHQAHDPAQAGRVAETTTLTSARR